MTVANEIEAYLDSIIECAGRIKEYKSNHEEVKCDLTRIDNELDDVLFFLEGGE